MLFATRFGLYSAFIRDVIHTDHVDILLAVTLYLTDVSYQILCKLLQLAATAGLALERFDVRAGID